MPRKLPPVPWELGSLQLADFKIRVIGLPHSSTLAMLGYRHALPVGRAPLQRVIPRNSVRSELFSPSSIYLSSIKVLIYKVKGIRLRSSTSTLVFFFHKFLGVNPRNFYEKRLVRRLHF